MFLDTTTAIMAKGKQSIDNSVMLKVKDAYYAYLELLIFRKTDYGCIQTDTNPIK
jgi:hypothetical protein